MLLQHIPFIDEITKIQRDQVIFEIKIPSIICSVSITHRSSIARQYTAKCRRSLAIQRLTLWLLEAKQESLDFNSFLLYYTVSIFNIYI